MTLIALIVMTPLMSSNIWIVRFAHIVERESNGTVGTKLMTKTMRNYGDQIGGKNMDVTKIREIAMYIISKNQINYSLKDDREQLIYSLAFNDGVLGMMDELIATINKTKVAESTEEQNDNT